MQWDCWQYLPDGTTREDLSTKFSISATWVQSKCYLYHHWDFPKKYFLNLKGSLVHPQIKTKQNKTTSEHLIFVAVKFYSLIKCQYLRIIYAKAVPYFDFWCFILSEYGSDLWKVVSRVVAAAVKNCSIWGLLGNVPDTTSRTVRLHTHAQLPVLM